jgi:wyosine [tRNA(Phe)-imidazoG37] synthetase (radical SAM superfamily)
MSTFRYLFGPVPSRRFGRSLGVDLAPFKTCTLDCPFCEVGLTTRQTLERKEYVPTAAILRELDAWSALKIPADFITLAGSGEPTLHSRFGDILDYIAEKKLAPSALLTNSTLLFMPEVRRAAAKAKVVKATLSAWDQASFTAVARPHPDLRFDQILDGLRRLRDEYTGAIWLEVFIVPGVNSAPEQARKIAALAEKIRPDRIQLNTAVRPTAEQAVQAVSAVEIRQLAALFTPPAELIARFKSGARGGDAANLEMILAMLRRRPCSAADIAAAFSLAGEAAERLLAELVGSGKVRVETRADRRYYRA